MVEHVLENKIFWHWFNPAYILCKKKLGDWPQVTFDQGWYNIEDKTHPGLYLNWKTWKLPDAFIVPTLSHIFRIYIQYQYNVA